MKIALNNKIIFNQKIFVQPKWFEGKSSSKNTKIASANDVVWTHSHTKLMHQT